MQPRLGSRTKEGMAPVCPRRKVLSMSGPRSRLAKSEAAARWENQLSRGVRPGLDHPRGLTGFHPCHRNPNRKMLVPRCTRRTVASLTFLPHTRISANFHPCDSRGRMSQVSFTKQGNGVHVSILVPLSRNPCTSPQAALYEYGSLQHDFHRPKKETRSFH